MCPSYTCLSEKSDFIVTCDSLKSAKLYFLIYCPICLQSVLRTDTHWCDVPVASFLSWNLSFLLNWCCFCPCVLYNLPNVNICIFMLLWHVLPAVVIDGSLNRGCAWSRCMACSSFLRDWLRGYFVSFQKKCLRHKHSLWKRQTFFEPFLLLVNVLVYALVFSAAIGRLHRLHFFRFSEHHGTSCQVVTVLLIWLLHCTTDLNTKQWRRFRRNIQINNSKKKLGIWTLTYSLPWLGF